MVYCIVMNKPSWSCSLVEKTNKLSLLSNQNGDCPDVSLE